jgi:hypothetical protein
MKCGGDVEAYCAKPARPGETWTLDRIVADYIERKRPRLARLLRFYATQRSLADAVEKAAYAKTPDGRKHSHQWRLPLRASEKAHAALERADLGRCRPFADLHAAVGRAIAGIDKIGVLMIYDTSLRLGAFLGLEPDVVHLHAGVREGAAALGIDRSRETVRPDELPAPFRALRPHEVEDCLCIYKAQLNQLR